MAGKLNYIKSIDGIRGVFCMVIIAAHWKLAFPITPLGWQILQIFFVMSGYLITRILLYDREKKKRFKPYIKSFYSKRTYRIFPLYFGYLFLMSAIRFIFKSSEFVQNQTIELKHSGVWLYTYLYNFKSWFNFHSGTPFEDTSFFSHLWSLSVEEQFYMIFPLFIFILRGRILKGFVILLIIAPQFLRMYGYPYLMSVNPDGDWAILLIYRNIFFQFDSIALGAALAIFNFSWIRKPKVWFYLVLAAIVVVSFMNYPLIRNSQIDVTGLPFDIFKSDNKLNFLGYLNYLAHPEILQFGKQYIYMIPLVNLCCFLLILCSIRDTPILRRLFENRLIVYLGKISYGMYVYHFCLLIVFLKALRTILPISPFELPFIIQFLLFFVYLGIVIGVSHLSYNYFEMFFLKLKKKIK